MNAMILIAKGYLDGEVSWLESKESMAWALAAVSDQQSFKILCEKIAGKVEE